MWRDYSKVLSSTYEAIGYTPTVSLSRLITHLGLEGNILAKLEYLNPGFSKKDRVALSIIEQAERMGELTHGQTIVELTSGNTGTGLAIVCSAKGYPFVAVMSEGNSTERASMMRALGAEVVLVPQAPGSIKGQVSGADLALVEEVTQKIVVERQAFRADQFHHIGNVLSHYHGTAEELLLQASNTGYTLDGFCDFIGSGGTFAGCSQRFKEAAYPIQCYAIEPKEAAVLSGHTTERKGHKIQGGGYAMEDLAYLKTIQPDGYLQVSDTEAITYSRLLAKYEGIFAGFSAGANLAGAVQLLQGPLKGKTIAILMCDSGLKYLSTDLWQEVAISS
ncbi:MAG: PLP-dependent cysteine synthase family protein [Vampirovibrionales bacterium]